MNRFYTLIIYFLVAAALIAAGFYFLHKRAPAPTAEILPPSSSSATSSPSATVLPQPAAATGTPTSLPPVEKIPEGTDQFVVSLDATSTVEVAASLLEKGFIKDQTEFISAFKSPFAFAGAYKLSASMTASQIATVLKGKPYMKWVVIPPGLRKEEIAGLLQIALGWTASQKTKWITVDTAGQTDYIEGVYFPDTYLIPVAESTIDVAKRLIAKFNEKFAVYLPAFNAKNIKWTKALTLASIVQREAANSADMPLIAGILWNRLDQGQPLDVDATLQYARGDTGKGFWAAITVADKKIDSPFNTYLHAGLPPHPISNPGIAAIDAVLNPTQTDCLYYLHDKNHVTHCAATYEEHQANIEKYLKN